MGILRDSIGKDENPTGLFDQGNGTTLSPGGDLWHCRDVAVRNIEKYIENK